MLDIEVQNLHFLQIPQQEMLSNQLALNYTEGTQLLYTEATENKGGWASEWWIVGTIDSQNYYTYPWFKNWTEIISIVVSKSNMVIST